MAVNRKPASWVGAVLCMAHDARTEKDMIENEVTTWR